MCEFIANEESLALWIPMVQGEEGRENRSRVKARREDGIRRKEKIAGLGLYKDWNEQRKVRSKRANCIEGTGNVTTLGEELGRRSVVHSQ